MAVIAWPDLSLRSIPLLSDSVIFSFFPLSLRFSFDFLSVALPLLGRPQNPFGNAPPLVASKPISWGYFLFRTLYLTFTVSDLLRHRSLRSFWALSPYG